ncbi:MAG: SAM-dependent methyltransferase [Lewinella sp.]|nr:SAM-dependent methyltransferase [Lewinella sp.]
MSPSPKGKLYLIPSPLGEQTLFTLPAYVIEIIHELDVFVVEKAKNARRYLKSVGFEKSFDDCLFFELNKHTQPQAIPAYLEPALAGRNIGLLSDAGVPGVADPGARLVRMAHRQNIEVDPLVGPSSILLALMASGLNGQGFAFHGYLSPKRPDLAKDLKRLENQSARTGETQLFIETPYRNTNVLETALQVLSPTTLFCMAVDLTLPTQLIRTHPIMEWKRIQKPQLHKRPAVFLLLGGK